jgi:diguanylate cyclase (GGDEF)-like protein/PAS domain S-box-containing protein
MTTSLETCRLCESALPPQANFCQGCGAAVRSMESNSHADLDLERFFGHALDMCCIAGVDGYFKRVNPAFERTLGYSTSELLERPYVDFVHPEDRAGTRAETGKLSTGEPTLSFENRYLCKDGSYRDLHWTSFPEPETGLLYAIARDITEQRRKEDRVDSLTGLATRRVFDETLLDEWKRAVRLRMSLAIALIDIDHFKAYNAEYGHQAGDERLRHLALIISERVRRAGDLVARYDGQEFAVIMNGGLDTNQAAKLCESIRSTVEQLEIPNDGVGSGELFSVSAGIAALVPTADLSADQLVDQAEAALQEAKQNGRNQVVGAQV